MKTIVFAICLISLGFVNSASAQQAVSSVNEGGKLTNTQLKHLAREARTSQQYETLASYYEQKQLSYQRKAAEEKQEWVRRSQNQMMVEAKYPRPVDSARYLYEYDQASAGEMSALSGKYRQMASQTTTTDQTTVSAH